jgi:hypothetical protein
VGPEDLELCLYCEFVLTLCHVVSTDGKYTDPELEVSYGDYFHFRKTDFTGTV